jgi:hypothetical protein
MRRVETVRQPAAPLIGGAVGALAYRLTRGPDEGPGAKEISGT